MKSKFVLITIVAILLISLIPMDLATTQGLPTTATGELDPNDLEFGLVTNSELWLKSGNELFYSQDDGKQWNKISPETSLVEPYMLVSFPKSDLGFALYLTQTETTVDMEIHKTSSQGKAWTVVDGNLDEKINQQFTQPFGDIQMQWLDKNNAMVLIRELTSSNFSVGTLFVTGDGGKHWNAREVPAAEQFVFLDNKVGFMLNPADSQSLYRTLNGGESWTLLDLNLPEFLDSTLIEPGLPIELADNRVYLPVKIIEGENQGGDFLVRIEPKASPKSIFSTDNLDVIPILVPSEQKQLSNKFASQISKNQTLDPQNLIISVAGGECQNVPAAGEMTDITCESNWQLLKSQSGGLGWETVSLPGNQTSITKTFTSSIQVPETDLDEKQMQLAGVVGNFVGHAFDKCEIPTLSQLQRWYTSSPYKAVNLYIGGVSRFCSNAALSAAYLRSMSLQGWRFIPTWVGPQAPCTSFKTKFSYDVNLAYQAGVDNANLARTKLMALGLTNPNGSGGIVYLDLEHFAYTESCSAAARSYVNGWTTRLSQLGIYSGLYSTSSGISTNRYFDIGKPPTAVWIAEWYKTPGFRPAETVWGLRYLSDSYWAYHQRIVQYSGGHDETWGGVTMNIDCNVADGPTGWPYGFQLYRRWFPIISKR